MARLVREDGGIHETLVLADGRGVHTIRGEPFELPEDAAAYLSKDPRFKPAAEAAKKATRQASKEE